MQCLLPSIAFTAILSGLGHKEWRFISYTVPFYNLSAARGADLLYDHIIFVSSFPCLTISRIRRFRTRTSIVLTILSVIGALALNFVATAMFTFAATLNYPGGEALANLGLLINPDLNCSVYIDNLAAQTGASRFLQSLSPPFPACDGKSSTSQPLCEYYKLADTLDGFTHIIVEDVEHLLPPSMRSSLEQRLPALTLNSLLTKLEPASFGEWRPLAVVYGFDGWTKDVEGSYLTKFMPFPYVAPKLWILERAN